MKFEHKISVYALSGLCFSPTNNAVEILVCAVWMNAQVCSQARVDCAYSRTVLFILLRGGENNLYPPYVVFNYQTQ